jgi:DNA-binding MarR family transcriptional regulator
MLDLSQQYVKRMPDIEDVDYSFGTSENNPGYLLWQVSTLWQRRLNQVLTPFNLSHAQFVLMAGLHQMAEKTNAEVTQAALALFSGIDPMTTSKAVRLLESKGYVARKDSAVDHRAHALELTGEGRDILARAQEKVGKSEHQFFAALAKEKRILKFIKFHSLLLAAWKTEEDKAKKVESVVF